MSRDYFYEQPDWFKTYRIGKLDIKLPWKTQSKYIGLEVGNFPADYLNNYQPANGSRVIIHNTNEFPFRTGQHLQYKTGETIHIEYTPTLDMIDDKLVSWPSEKRNCYLENEKTLKYFKIYTRINCEHECLSEAILKACECLPFYMISELNL